MRCPDQSSRQAFLKIGIHNYMKWGYEGGADGKPLAPIFLSEESHCHALITGGSGSGKSYAVLFLLGMILKSCPDIDIYFCDFKNSLDFSFLMGYPHYFAGDNVYEGVLAYYNSFCDARRNRRSNRRHLLIFDEYPAFVNYLNTIDKRDKSKKASDVLGSIAEVLMLGRGIGYGVWIVTQRPDASLFSLGARDNLMIVVGLGRMSKEQKAMVFTGEEIPDRIFGRGEGMLLADGYPIKQVKYPCIRNIYEWKQHIKLVLMKHRFDG